MSARRLFYLKLSVVVLCVLLAISTFGTLFLQRYLNAPLKLPESGINYILRPGVSLSTAIDELRAQGILSRSSVLFWWARIRGLEKKILAGEYHFPYGTRRSDLLEYLRSGKVHSYSLSLIEGWTFERSLQYIHTLPQLENTLGEMSVSEIRELLGLSEYISAEGWFFPDTYYFQRGMSDLDILKIAHRRMQNVLGEEWRERDANLPYASPYEALILASIVEMEAGVPDEYQRIAGVFVRRLDRGMRLEGDPTVIYGLGADFNGNLKRVHLQDRSNPYNSYRHRGLPPTPISLPGRASLRAALQPLAEESLYFVARGDGTHVFSDTLDEHNAAVHKYIRGGQKKRPREARR